MTKRTSDFSNRDWSVEIVDGENIIPEDAHLCVLADIRSELQKLNALLHRHSFTSIPQMLKDIRRNITREKRGKK